MSLVYRLLQPEEWAELQRTGRFAGARMDLRDGYIHLSKAAQVLDTWHRHCRELGPLLLLGLDPQALGAALRDEPVRNQTYPHLYGEVRLEMVRTCERLPAD